MIQDRSEQECPDSGAAFLQNASQAPIPQLANTWGTPHESFASWGIGESLTRHREDRATVELLIIFPARSTGSLSHYLCLLIKIGHVPI